MLCKITKLHRQWQELAILAPLACVISNAHRTSYWNLSPCHNWEYATKRSEFSDFIAIFAMSVTFFIFFGFATLR